MYKNPVPTVDIIIEMNNGIVVIERKNEPFGWALPGGFVDYGESVEQAARREAKEETNLELIDMKQFRVYSDPERDPRMHTISVVFIAKGKGVLRANDDAKNAVVVNPKYMTLKMAFDHKKIIDDYLKYKEKNSGE